VTYIKETIIVTRVGWDYFPWYCSFRLVYCTICWWQMGWNTGGTLTGSEDNNTFWNRVPVLLIDYTGISWGIQVGNIVKIKLLYSAGIELMPWMSKWENITDSCVTTLHGCGQCCHLRGWSVYILYLCRNSLIPT
jgi:hypothetical protein